MQSPDPGVVAYLQNVRFGNEQSANHVRPLAAYHQHVSPSLGYTPKGNVYLPDPRALVASNVANFHLFFANQNTLGKAIYEIGMTKLGFDKSPLKDPAVSGVELTMDQFQILLCQLLMGKIPSQNVDTLMEIQRKTEAFVEKNCIRQYWDPEMARACYNDTWQNVLLNLVLRTLTTPGRSLDEFTRYRLLDQLCPPRHDRYGFRKLLPTGATSLEALHFFYGCIRADPQRFVDSLWLHRNAIKMT
jgi:hypothetical protein